MRYYVGEPVNNRKVIKNTKEEIINKVKSVISDKFLDLWYIVDEKGNYYDIELRIAKRGKAEEFLPKRYLEGIMESFKNEL